jgi:hypothetical protein
MYDMFLQKSGAQHMRELLSSLEMKKTISWEKNSEPYKSSGLHIRHKGPTNPPMSSSSSSFYLCNVCHAIFGNKAELNRHILIHSSGAKGGGEERMYSERRVPRGSRWW